MASSGKRVFRETSEARSWHGTRLRLSQCSGYKYKFTQVFSNTLEERSWIRVELSGRVNTSLSVHHSPHFSPQITSWQLPLHCFHPQHSQVWSQGESCVPAQDWCVWQVVSVSLFVYFFIYHTHKHTHPHRHPHPSRVSNHVPKNSFWSSRTQIQNKAWGRVHAGEYKTVPGTWQKMSGGFTLKIQSF